MENIVSLLINPVSPWHSVREKICAECNDFGTAILDAIGYEGFEAGYVLLTAPDTFRETWLNSHYGNLLRKYFAQELGSAFKIGRAHV